MVGLWLTQNLQRGVTMNTNEVIFLSHYFQNICELQSNISYVRCENVKMFIYIYVYINDITVYLFIKGYLKYKF